MCFVVIAICYLRNLVDVFNDLLQTYHMVKVLVGSVLGFLLQGQTALLNEWRAGKGVHLVEQFCDTGTGQPSS